MSLTNLYSVSDMFRHKYSIYQKKSIRWLAQRPTLTFAFIIMCGVVLLPVITMIALTPVAVIVNYAGIFATGGIGAIYDVLFKGSLLAAFFVGLVATGFLIITCFSVMHSYKLFSLWPFQKKYN